jgi:hypothetical protein
MDKQKAEQIARSFFEQQHDVHNTKAVRFENGIWLVEGVVSSGLGENIKKLRIDAKTGMIVNVE